MCRLEHWDFQFDYMFTQNPNMSVGQYFHGGFFHTQPLAILRSVTFSNMPSMYGTLIFQVRETIPLSGRSGILGEQKNNHFRGVVVKGEKVFVITQSGLLCELNDKRLLDRWVELRVNTCGIFYETCKQLQLLPTPPTFMFYQINSFTEMILSIVLKRSQYSNTGIILSIKNQCKTFQKTSDY